MSRLIILFILALAHAVSAKPQRLSVLLTSLDFSDSTGNASFSYDRAGRTRTTNVYSSTSFQRTSVAVPGTITINYTYDTGGRLSTVSEGSFNATYSYQANSPLVSQILLKQGTTTRLTRVFGYDHLNRLTYSKSTPGSSTAFPWEYSV